MHEYCRLVGGARGFSHMQFFVNVINILSWMVQISSTRADLQGDTDGIMLT